MINKPFTGNKKKLTLVAASAALVLSLSSPAAFANDAENPEAYEEPGDDALIDDSAETPREEEVAEEAPIEDEPAEPGDDDLIDDSGETPSEPEPSEPEPADDETPAEPEEPAEPVEDDEPVDEEEVPEEDTGAEPPSITPPTVEPDEPGDEDGEIIVTDESQNPDSPVRVHVIHMHEDGAFPVETRALSGDVGMRYSASNLAFLSDMGYEVMDTRGELTGRMGEDLIEVTFIYTGTAIGGVTPPVTTPVEPGDDTPTEPGDDTPAEPGDDELIDDSEETPRDEDEDTEENAEEVENEENNEGATDENGEPIVTDEDAVPVVRPVLDVEPGDDDLIDDSEETPSNDDTATDNDENVAGVGGTNNGDEQGERGAVSQERAEADKNAANGELKAIPQASAETNWLMVGMGALAMAGASVMLFGRRAKEKIFG